MKSNEVKKETVMSHPIHPNKFNKAEIYLSQLYDFRLNTVALTIEYKEKGNSHFIELNENSLFRELQKANISLPMSSLVSLLRSDFVETYDPIAEYFENLPLWNGKSNIQRLASYVHTKEQPGWENHLMKHLVRTVKCALVPQYFNKQALILAGPKQNSGKSTFCRSLCPAGMKNYIAEDINTDKDSRILLAKNLIINLDELALLSKKDINSLKSFMSKDQVNERIPYDRKNSVLPRRASFVGSTNNLEFLDDETGSVRWICFEITDINWNYSTEVNMDEVWAEAYHLFKMGFNADLTAEEILISEERNRGFHVLTLERELIEKFFEFDFKKDPKNFKTSSEILIAIQDQLSGVKINQVNLGKALNTLSCPSGRDTYTRRGYFLFLKQPD